MIMKNNFWSATMPGYNMTHKFIILVSHDFILPEFKFTSNSHVYTRSSAPTILWLGSSSLPFDSTNFSQWGPIQEINGWIFSYNLVEMISILSRSSSQNVIKKFKSEVSVKEIWYISSFSAIEILNDHLTQFKNEFFDEILCRWSAHYI